MNHLINYIFLVIARYGQIWAFYNSFIHSSNAILEIEQKVKVNLSLVYLKSHKLTDAEKTLYKHIKKNVNWTFDIKLNSCSYRNKNEVNKQLKQDLLYISY